MKLWKLHKFLGGASALIGSSLSPALVFASAQTKSLQSKSSRKDEDENVATNEDLMREHGVLNRILLIYEEAIRRIQSLIRATLIPR